MILFDSDHKLRVQARACNLQDPSRAFLLDHAWEGLSDRLRDIKSTFKHSACLNNRAGARQCADLVHTGKFESSPTLISFTPSDEVLKTAPDSFDCILSVFDLHTLHDLPTALAQIRHALTKNGVFLGVFPGGRTLYELRTCLMKAETALTGGVHPRIHPMINLQNLSHLIQQAGFSLPVVDHEEITVHYKTLATLFTDLRGMGETNILAARARRFPPRTLFSETEKIYRTEWNEPEGTLPATFDLLYLIGWK